MPGIGQQFGARKSVLEAALTWCEVTPEVDLAPHPKFPFGRKGCGPTGGQGLDVRYFEKHSPDSYLLSETSLHDRAPTIF